MSCLFEQSRPPLVPFPLRASCGEASRTLSPPHLRDARPYLALPQSPLPACSKVYDMCTQKPPHCCSDELYKRYGLVLRTYLTDSALPEIKKKQHEYMLEEFSYRWKNHQLMVKWMKNFFGYLVRTGVL